MVGRSIALSSTSMERVAPWIEGPETTDTNSYRAFDDARIRLCLAPSPRGAGRTLANWRVLADAGADDLDAARLTEAHLDAATILHELDGPAVPPGSRWGVWAAEATDVGVLRAETHGPGVWELSGAKPWCSGARGPSGERVCSHALVTAHADDGRRLFAVDLTDPGVSVRDGAWQTTGMTASAATTVDFDHVAAVPVGGPRAYLERPGFWHGGVAVAAAWFGGAVAVAAPLRRAGLAGRLDAHGFAHLGTVDAALAAARAVLTAAAHAVDDPAASCEPVADAQRRARQVRAVVEHAVETAVRHTGRGAGPGPLAHDGIHAQRVTDLQLYVRQSHAERDLAALGELSVDDSTVL